MMQVIFIMLLLCDTIQKGKFSNELVLLSNQVVHFKLGPVLSKNPEYIGIKEKLI